MRVYLSALGCKLNEGELEAWTRQFASQGHEIVDDAREADLCVVNTCTVTHAAARKSRGLAKRISITNKDAKIILTGCYATIAPEEARSLSNVAFVVPNSDKDQLVALAGKLWHDSAFQISGNGCRMPEAASGNLSSEADPPPSPLLKGGDASLSPQGKAQYPPSSPLLKGETLRVRQCAKLNTSLRPPFTWGEALLCRPWSRDKTPLCPPLRTGNRGGCLTHAPAPLSRLKMDATCRARTALSL